MNNLFRVLDNDNLAKSIINSLPFPFYIHNKEGILIFTNSNAGKLTGYTTEEIQGKHFLEFFRNQESSAILEVNKTAMKKGFATTQIKLLSKYNTIKDVLITAIRYNHNSDIYILGFVIDLTERIETENELKNALHQIQILKEELIKENTYLREEIKSNFAFDDTLLKSSFIKKLVIQIQSIANTDDSVLIQGESGTGKELISRTIHSLSARKEKPIVKINCNSIPATEIERELFGFVKGAFIGASKSKMGKIEIANGGSIIIEGISMLPIDLQEKVLQVLQTGEFSRIGSKTIQKSDIRILAISKKNLLSEVSKENFRSDLYYKLSSKMIEVTPLRTRKTDIPLLAQFYINNFAKEQNREINKPSKDFIYQLKKYNWPGNTRELQNVLERAIMVCDSSNLQVENISSILSKQKRINPKFKTLQETEKDYIIHVLNHTQGKIRGKNGAAEILNINPTTLESRMKKLGIKN